MSAILNIVDEKGREADAEDNHLEAVTNREYSERKKETYQDAVPSLLNLPQAPDLDVEMKSDEQEMQSDENLKSTESPDLLPG